MTETTDPQELYRDPEEGGCSHFRDPGTCEECALDERVLRHMRALAAVVAARPDEIIAELDSLGKVLATLTADPCYAEFYASRTADEDAAACLADALRALRSFARIARERAARTEQNP